MNQRHAAALRQEFLQFFVRHGHTQVKSSPLVPANDPTLMFVNAGMVQFKDIFTGVEARPYRRAASCQKCMRVSGKHNDLEEVGRTARHHTLFEMLGNFSFGDYFKEEAIQLAWQFITQEMGLSRDRLWVTVFGGAEGVPADDEARRLWQKISGLKQERILSKGMKDNFWAMGETGPCGPCTEIHYDTRVTAGAHGPTGNAAAAGGQVPPVCADDFDNGRVVEIWNNVFMQFDRQPGGMLQPLPAPSVDTGMGLERLCALVQGKTSNYHTDLFMPLLEATAAGVHKRYQASDSLDDISMRVIADHARATAFLIADGVQPSNEGRGYVLRRIMRRAIRHGKRLGYGDIFLKDICGHVVDLMQPSYPELTEARALIDKLAQVEEEGFRRTLDAGLKILEEELAQASTAQGRELSGGVVFKLYDTYGFPKDLTQVIAEEQGVRLDEAGFQQAMQAQKERSRASEVGGTAVAAVYKMLAARLGATRFVGYTHEDTPLSEREGQWRKRIVGTGVEYIETKTAVVAVLCRSEPAGELHECPGGKPGDENVEVVLQPTPFYGESGGQTGDRGLITNEHGLLLEVLDTQKPVENLSVCRVKVLAGELQAGQAVWAGYPCAERKATRAHHSATHLLHAALRQVLGEHVRQAGSSVEAGRCRFDYTHFAALDDQQIAQVEAAANQAVQARAPVQTEVLPFEEAKQKGAMALFGEKYGDVVRVVSMGGSLEFCGGTHAQNTADIGMIIIHREEAVATGVRRLEAQVGEAAVSAALATAARLRLVVDLLLARPVAPSDHPIVAAVAKTARQYYESVEALRVQGAKPQAIVATASLHQPPEQEAAQITYEVASTLRTLWQTLVQLANARGSGGAAALLESGAQRDPYGILSTLAQMQLAVRANERHLAELTRTGLHDRLEPLLQKVREVGAIRVLASRVEGVDAKGLRDLADTLRPQLGSGIVCLGSDEQGKAALLVAVTKDLVQRFSAGDLMKELAPLINGRGGGKPELAQAGGTQPEALEEVFARLTTLVRAQQS